MRMPPSRNTLRPSCLAQAAAILLVSAAPLLAQGQTDVGIPVTDRLVLARCGTCHAADERGNLQRISWARATPEGWQAVIQRMIRENDVSLTPLEARAIVRYLSTRHGLAPEESKPVMHYAERRVHDEAATVNAALLEACARCHEAARALSWRRTADGWKAVYRHARRAISVQAGPGSHRSPGKGRSVLHPRMGLVECACSGASTNRPLADDGSCPGSRQLLR